MAFVAIGAYHCFQHVRRQSHWAESRPFLSEQFYGSSLLMQSALEKNIRRCCSGSEHRNLFIFRPVPGNHLV